MLKVYSNFAIDLSLVNKKQTNYKRSTRFNIHVIHNHALDYLSEPKLNHITTQRIITLTLRSRYVFYYYYSQTPPQLMACRVN
jgi:hypothetical protein